MNRSKSPFNSEIERYKKELIHAREQIADLQEELEEKANLYIKAIHDRDSYQQKLFNAKESIQRVDAIVQSKVNLALEKERRELSRLTEENELLRKRIEIFDQEKLAAQQRERQLQDKINGLTQDRQFYMNHSSDVDVIARIESLREERDAKEARIAEHLELINTLQRQLEDLAAENRALRNMQPLPENFGFDLATLKLNAEKKIENYTKLIKVLQDDNYKLEEERARLKHMLKQQSMLYTNNQPWDRYPTLTPEELFKVDQYVLKLQAGEAEEPADFYKLKKENTILKAQLEALNSKGMDFAKATIEAFLKELGINGSDSGKLFDKLNQGNEDLKKMIRDLINNQGTMVHSVPIGGNSTGPQFNFAQGGRFRPPQPNMGLDGEVANGYSHKFQANLEVADRDGRQGLGDHQTKYDVAFLQLQLMECFEILKRKDDELQTKNLEIDALYKRVRDYLLIQDQLYKDFVKTEKETIKAKEELTVKIRNVTDSLNEEQRKVEKYQELVQQLQAGVNQQSIQARLIELTKQNSMLDINLLRLTRKYQILAEQEDLLRREYNNREADLGEKDRFVQQRINSLKEWKARAIQQLKFLFTKLRLAVPRTEFESVQGENELLKQRNADYIERNSKLAEKVSKLQTQVRSNMEAEERYRNLQEAKDDLENEYEVVRKRLEHMDPQYKWENAIFNKVVSVLKRHRVSPQQAFDEFDKDKNGKLSRDEFLRALEMLKIADLSQQEIDILLSACDSDSDGSIKYKEFVRKLSRHGVKARTPEEQILILLIESLKKSGIKSMSDAFDLFDKKRQMSLSKEDFKDVFKSMTLRISDDEVDRFIDHFWRDQKAGIDYEAFLRIFQRYQLKLEEDDQRARKQAAYRVPDEVIRLKKNVYQTINTALAKHGKKIESLFQRADIDNSNQIDVHELGALFAGMKIPIVESELQNIFASIDFDLSGKISMPEFITDFKKTCETDILTLLQMEKERFEAESRKYNPQPEYMQAMEGMQYGVIAGGAGRMNPEMQAQTKIAILETREKQLNRKLETAMSILNNSNQSLLEVQKLYDNLDKRWTELVDQCMMDKQHIRTLEEHLRQSIRKDDAKRLQEQNEGLQTDLAETKAALLSYKNMNETVSDQVKALKLILERRKDENENLVQAVRELSSQSEDQKRLGKLYYLVMLSRWQEAALSRKYEAALNEGRELRKELINTEQLLQNKENDHHRAENMLQDALLEAQKLRKVIADSKNIFLTLEKAEEFNSRLTEVTDEKTVLEEQYFTMRAKYRSNQLTMDEAMARAEHAQELLDTLQKSKQSELGDRMIQLSEKLQAMKLGEMRATRERDEVKEKNNYLSRLYRTSLENVKKLEERVAQFESTLAKKEEEFRRADNERMRRFFNAQFDLPGALASNARSSTEHIFSGSAGIPSARNPTRTPANINESPTTIQRRMFGAADSNAQNSGAIQTLNKQSSFGGQNQGDTKFLESKIRKLEQELNKVLEDVCAKDAIINRFKEWQLADRYLSEDEVLREAIENQKSRTSMAHEQESKELAEAAAQMVKTLQLMIDQKNEQIASKDDQLEKLRQQMIAQSEKDGLEIAQLRQQFSLASGNTLAKLQEIVAKTGHNHQAQGYAGGQRYEKLTREELSRNLDEKDALIHKQMLELKAQEAQLSNLKTKYQEVLDIKEQLEADLYQERQQIELKAKVRELEKVRRELEIKDKKCEALKNSIGDLNKRMMEYEIAKSGVNEDSKMQKIQDDLKKKEFDNELSKFKTRVTMLEASKKQMNDDLKQSKIREQELADVNRKLTTERDESKSQFKMAQERLTQEIRQREKLQMEMQNYLRQINNVKNSAAGQLDYDGLLQKNRMLEMEVYRLKSEAKTRVKFVDNHFEYVEKAKLLDERVEYNNIEDLMQALHAYLERPENNQLSLESIFRSLDLGRTGSVKGDKFDSAFEKIGLMLRPGERNLLKDYLDPKALGEFNYTPLVREIKGLPQLEFIQSEIIRLAKSVVEARDLDEETFRMLIDPDRISMMTLPQLQQSIGQVKNDQFMMSSEEVETLFKNVTKSQRTIGVQISVAELTQKVFRALDALLIERMRNSVKNPKKPLQELFDKYDSNKDGFLEYQEFENMLLECELAFKNKIFDRLCTKVLDLNKKASKISFEKFIDVVGASPVKNVNQYMKPVFDQKPSHDKAEEDINPEFIQICRSAARKILNQFKSNIYDVINQGDKFNEGLIDREELKKIIGQVPDLNNAELNLLLQMADKGNKGYVSTEKFVEKLQMLMTETKEEVTVRSFAQNVKRQAINLQQELFKYDVSRSSRLDKKTFAKALNQMPITLNDDAVDILFQAGESLDYRGTLDINEFIKNIRAAAKYTPPVQIQLQQPKPKNQGGQNKEKIAQPGFESWEIEKKYKTKLTALQQQIEESKKETQAVEKQAKHWQEMANRLDKEKNALQTRLVDFNAKPPKAQAIESNSQAALELQQQLKDQVFYLQEENTKLEKQIQVDLKAEVQRQMRENDKLTERNRDLTEDVKRLQQQLGRLLGRTEPMDPIERREEGEMFREKMIQDLTKEVQAREERENELTEQLFRAESKILDLKFQKETFDLQYARLQKRITDLEQYKLASSKYSSVLKHKEDQDREKAAENAGVTASALLGAGPQTKKESSGDSVKLRSKGSKSVVELEMLVESLKRVIEKQKTEAESLKLQIEAHEKRADKLKSEKQLRQRIESLEAEVHSYEMKDVNVGEKDGTIKKLITANRQLKEDLEREMERYTLLENKYKDLLVKFNALAKENSKYADMMFTSTTGAKMNNFNSYLTASEAGAKTASDGFSKKFEDMY